MAAEYYASTQYANWTFDNKAELRKTAPVGSDEKSVTGDLPLPESRLQRIYFQQQLTKLGRRLNVRQVVHGTALVYIHRLYSRVDVRRTNPYLVVATALYLACKIEEYPQHIRVVTNEARNLWPDFIRSDTSQIGECEFIMISEMQAQLVVHHPYRYLFELQRQLVLTQDEVNLAWSIVNDHYLTDLPLLHTPQTMALAATVLAITVRPSQSAFHGTTMGTASGRSSQLSAMQNRGQALQQCLAQDCVDTEGVVECTQELISLYVVWEEYSEKTCKEQIGRYVKAKGLDK